MDRDRVYFTWPNDAFRYTCAGCGECCKGHGIGLDVTGGQLVQLVKRMPGIASFVRRRGDTITAFNPRDRCWFLDDGGLCRIETEAGRDAKPASCRLFPFNRVFRIGGYTVVDYNSVICPLSVGESGISHDEIVAEIESIADPAVIGTNLPARNPEAEGKAFVDGERACADTLFEAAKRVDIKLGWSAQADLAAWDTEVATVEQAFLAITGLAWRAPDAATLSNALYLTPSMRFNELYGPRQYAPRSEMAPILARMWLAWLGFVRHGQDLSGGVGSLQRLTMIWSEQAPLMHAIARWSEAPALKPGPVDLPGVDPEGRVRTLAQRFVDNRTAKPKRKSLGDLVAQLPDDPVVRVTTLKLAESVLRAGFAR